MDEQSKFLKDIRDALIHLYDAAYLECHPLISELIDRQQTSNRLSRAQMLRSLLKEKIELLRPRQGSPTNAPKWRSYLALRYRYVQEMSLLEIEEDLGISRRQLQREIRKGLEGLTALLWESRITSAAVAVEQDDQTKLLREELNEWEMNRQSYAVEDLIDDTRWMLKPLLEQRNVALAVSLDSALPPVFVDPILARHALLKVLRLTVQATGTGQLFLQVIPRAESIEIVLQNDDTDVEPAPFNDTVELEKGFQEEENWRTADLLVRRQGGVLKQTLTGVVISLPQASRVRVLVIDDNEATHRLFERYLAPHNYQVIGLTKGTEALQVAADLKPDLIILDLMIPSMDGWQVLRQLQDNEATRHIPKVICSVFKEPELALSLGARAFIKKPVDRMELLSVLEQVRNAPAAEAAARPADTASS
jgi:CheY-like chemotaxis protein